MHHTFPSMLCVAALCACHNDSAPMAQGAFVAPSTGAPRGGVGGSFVSLPGEGEIAPPDASVLFDAASPDASLQDAGLPLDASIAADAGLSIDAALAQCPVLQAPFDIVTRSMTGDCGAAGYLVDPTRSGADTVFIPPISGEFDVCQVSSTSVFGPPCLLQQRVLCSSGRSQLSDCVIQLAQEGRCTTEIRDASGICTIEAIFTSRR